MKVLKLSINGTVYTTAKITAYNARQALKFQREILEIGKKANAVSRGEALEDAEAIMDALLEMNDRRSLLVVDVFGHKFSVEELERELSDEEINTVITGIVSGVSGIVEKN